MVNIHKYITQHSRFEVAMERSWGPLCFGQLYLEDCTKLRSLNNFRCVYTLYTVVGDFRLQLDNNLPRPCRFTNNGRLYLDRSMRYRQLDSDIRIEIRRSTENKALIIYKKSLFVVVFARRKRFISMILTLICRLYKICLQQCCKPFLITCSKVN